MYFTFKKNNKQTKKPVNRFLQDDASAGIRSLQTSTEIKLCQNPWNGLSEACSPLLPAKYIHSFIHSFIDSFKFTQSVLQNTCNDLTFLNLHTSLNKMGDIKCIFISWLPIRSSLKTKDPL